MLYGNVVNEKTTVLDYIGSLLNYSQVENKPNCFGSEFNSCSCYYRARARVYMSRLNSYSYVYVLLVLG